MSDHKAPQGAGWLLGPSDTADCFTPEELGDEHRMIYQTSVDFALKECAANLERIESKDEQFIRGLMAKAGELGLNGTDVPEEYGGLGLDKISTAVLTEAISYAPSFSGSHGAHTGIGTLPIVLYGTKEQKEKYLPDLAMGTKIAAYALTEAGAGSDAVGGCRTKAVLTQDGKHYILNGEKIFITNGAWADTIIVFAKIDGAEFSAFIVERDFEGVSSGAEEKKLGIKGSSTTPIILEDAKVPAENLLYAAGKGPAIAMNVLNIGRYKLGVATVGGCKGSLKTAVDYAAGRQQFGRAIIDFGAIREKLARMATYTYVSEALNYRLVGDIDKSLQNVDSAAEDYGNQVSDAIREYSVECSISKVYGSESLSYCVDECLQIHGGYGYIAEYPAERHYRDSRINRIFEGTNEINRMTIPGEILKRAMKGTLPLMAAAQKLMGEIMDYSPMMVELPDEPLALQAHMIENCKKATLYVAGLAAQKLMQKLAHEQEVLLRSADMLIETYAMESALLRARKAIAAQGLDKAAFHVNCVMAYVDETIPRLHKWGNEVLAYLEKDDDLRTVLIGLRKLLKYQPISAIAVRQAIADRVVEMGGYPLSY